MKKWRCTVCGYVYEGEEPPEVCPLCGVPADKFELVEDEQPHIQQLLVAHAFKRAGCQQLLAARFAYL